MGHHPLFCHYFLVCKVVCSSATPRRGSVGIGSRPSGLNLGGDFPSCIGLEAGWVLEPVWTALENNGNIKKDKNV